MGVGSITRFVALTLLNGMETETATQSFLRGWIMRFGIPKRIIVYQGGPCLAGRQWKQLSHVFGWQYIRAPTRATNRMVWLNDECDRCQQRLKLLLWANGICVDSRSGDFIGDIEKPHPASDNRPTTSIRYGWEELHHRRCEYIHVAARSVVSRFTDTASQFLRGILDARNANIQADSENAAKIRSGRNLPDRGGSFAPVGESEQISIGGKWIGAFCAIARAAREVLVERVIKILKWPKCKTRLSIRDNRDVVCLILLPSRTRRGSPRPSAGGRNSGRRCAECDLPEDELEELEFIDIDDAPVDVDNLIRDSNNHHPESTNSSSMGEDSWGAGLTSGSLAVGHRWPEPTYVSHGSIISEDYEATPQKSRIGRAFFTYYQMDSLLVGPDAFKPNAQTTNHSRNELHRQFAQTKKDECPDEDILVNSDTSLIPPMIAFRLTPARWVGGWVGAGGLLSAEFLTLLRQIRMGAPYDSNFTH